MKTKYLLFALPLVAICACNKNDVEEVTKKVNTITAIAVQDDDTKTTIDGSSLTMSWTGGETAHVHPLPTTYPGAGDPEVTHTLTGEDFAKLWPVYNFVFTNTSSAGTTAEFSPATTYTEGFPSLQPRIIAQPDVYVYYERASSTATAVSKYHIRQVISHNQDFDSSNALGLAENAIPIYGFVCKGKGSGFEPEAVKMKTFAAIIKLVVTNNTLYPITINNITMSSSLTGTGGGLAGAMYRYINASTLNESTTVPYFYSGNRHNTITLDCHSYVLGAGSERVFSFVTQGNMRRDLQGNFTWNIYYKDKDNIDQIKTESNNIPEPPATPVRILTGKIYTKAVSI